MSGPEKKHNDILLPELKEYSARSEFKPLTHVIRDVVHQGGPSLSQLGNPFHHALNAGVEAFRHIEDQLREQGVHEVAYVNIGSYAIVVKLNDAEIGRLSNFREKSRPEDSEWLQPTFVLRHPRLKMEILPRGNMKGVTREQATKLLADIIDKGYYPTDALGGNVCLLTDGTPVFSDPDIASKIPKFLLPVVQPVMRLLYTRDTPDITYDYQAAQEKHLKSLGLVKGHIGIQLPAPPDHDLSPETSRPRLAMRPEKGLDNERKR